METELKQKEGGSFVDNNQHIKYNTNYLFYNREDLVDDNEDLICPICLFILKNPINCSDNQNSHSFCKECIDKYLSENTTCPICKNMFEYKRNEDLNKSLDRLSFKCRFKTEGCNDIIPYSEYLNHIKECKYNNIKYECQIKKYSYKKKEFEECGFIGNKNEIEKHFKICANTNYRCIFCNKDILQKNLKEHVEKVCIFTIEKNIMKEIYIGQKRNGMKEGYGILYYPNGNKYEGEWKNGLREGYGIYYYANGDRYEG